MITQKEAFKILDDFMQSQNWHDSQSGETDYKFPWENLIKYPPDIPPVMMVIDGETYYGTREEAIELGLMRDPNKPLTLRDKIRGKLKDWHESRAAHHEYKAR